MSKKTYETEQLVKIENTKIGEYVRKVRMCGTCRGEGMVQLNGAMDIGACTTCSGKGYIATNKTYTRDEYMKSDLAYGFKGGYGLTDVEDVNRPVAPLKKGTLVLVGFSY